MRADPGAVADLAGSVADGSAVDWAGAEAKATEPERRLIRHLRLVENIAALHRSAALEDPETDEAFAPSTVRRWGRLALHERVGEGVSGEVYRATDTELLRDVALKLLRQDDRGGHERILGEARRLARVRHAHVVHVYGAEKHDGRVGLWMELVSGESLEQIVKTRGRFGAREASLIGLDLCAALAAVHQAGLLHRDVKAQNVVREAGGRIVLMDFGTGEELRENSGSNRMVGTPLYLAPEVFRGQAASAQSDLYSLGVLLFYLVTGEYPVTAGSMLQLAQAHAKGRSRLLRDVRPDLPQSFVGIVERALDPDPSRRYRSAGELEAALRDALAPTAVLPEEIRPRHTWFHFGVAVAALLVVVVGLIVWTSRFASTGPQGVHRVAVLPMEASGSVPPDLADGLTNQLASTLGQIQSLRVVAAQPREGDRELRWAGLGAALGVDSLVQGVVSLEVGAADVGDMVRVNVRLIDASTGTTVWSQSFARRRGEAVVLLGAVARGIAAAVDARVSSEEAGRLRAAQQTNPAAEEAYLQGRAHIDRYGADRARLALDAFQRATQLDPGYAPARAGAARAYVSLGLHGAISQSSARVLALTEARSALELNEQLPDAHFAQALILFLHDWDWMRAEQHYERSLQLNPSFTSARLYYAQLLAARQRFDEALEQIAQAQLLDPQSPDVPLFSGMIRYYQRDYDSASGVLHRAAEQAPESAAVYMLLGRVAEAQGRLDEALTLTRRASDLSGGGGGPLQVGLARLMLLAGQSDGATTLLASLERDLASKKLRMSARDLGYLRLAQGRTDAALDAFDQAFDERDPSLVWLGVDPRLDPLRDQPRFIELLRKIGLP